MTYWGSRFRQLSRLMFVGIVLLSPKGLALVLIGKPASQSFYNDPNTSPDKAIDGDVNTVQHTLRCAGEQWWMVDLQAIYCLTKITIVSRRDCCGWRLADAVVRAGLNASDFSQNTRIGSVSSSQATTGAVIDFMVDPVVSARYVSVQLNGNGIRNKCLHMAEVRVEEIQDSEDTSSVAGRVDVTLVASPAVLGPTGNNGSTLAAYKSPTDIAAAVSFGRQLTTGGSNDHLPTGAVGFYDASLGCKARLLSLPEAGGIDRTGVFYSTANRNGVMTKIRSIILPTDDIIHTSPLQRTQTVSTGESIILQMEDVNSPNTNYRWKRNGIDMPIWDGMLSVSIVSVTQADEGIYSCFADGQENQQRHGFMRLIVRECTDGTWGPPSCESVCRRCYNGGICEDLTGRCVCGPGFSGEHCENVHGRHVFGQDAGHTCSDSPDPHHDACRGRLFCLPDPYGCSCAAGYTGMDCMQECKDGTYGASCKQTCHCSPGDTCEKDSGECSGNCVTSYFGRNCQCSAENIVLGLKVIPNDPRALFVSWQPDPCVSGYKLEYALTNRGQCEKIESPQRVVFPNTLDAETTSQVIIGLEDHSTYMVYILPQYSSTQGPEVSTSGTTLRQTNLSVSPVRITSYDSVSVTLSWREVNCATYSVEYGLGDRDHCEPFSPVTYSLHCMCTGTNVTVISGLTANSMYKVRVRASLDGNYGLAEEADVVTGPREPSEPPAQVAVTLTAQRSLSFSWSQPPCGGRGGVIIGYTYRLTEDESNAQVRLSVVSKESATVDDLTPYTKYSFQVLAYTSVGDGPYSIGLIAGTLEAEPTVPLNVAIQNVDEFSITVKWSKPNPPQGIITHYNVRYWRSGQTGSQMVDRNLQPLMYLITGLEKNVTYFMQVQAETLVGAGPWSNAVNATTRIGVPGLVRNLRWTDRTNSKVTLEWEPPISPNGQIQNYVAEYRVLEKPYQPDFTPADEYIRKEVPRASFRTENLEPGTKYEFRVSVENELFIGPGQILEVYTKPSSVLPAPPQPISYPDDATDTTAIIGIIRAVPGDEFIESYVVQVKKARSSPVTKRDVLIPKHFQDSPDDYIAAEFPKGGVPDRFVVGDAKLYGGYYNAPLQRGAVYNIRVGSVSRGNETEANVEHSEPLTVRVQQANSGPTTTAVALGVIVCVLVVFIVTILIVWKRRKARFRAPENVQVALTPKPKEIDTPTVDIDNAGNSDKDDYEDIGLLPSWASAYEIRWEDFIVEDVILGTGNFGEVRAGGVKMDGKVIKAAIKTLKETAPETAWEDFKKELQTMTKIKPHPNVVGLLGACFQQGVLYMALEYLPTGNLRDYLRNTRPNQGAANSKKRMSTLTSENLLKFGLDVAKGMEHLSVTGIIHRDLAARNILLSDDMTAKVSDFGLSRGQDVYVQNSSTRIPVRWLALESLTLRVYKSKSDVWSFGILLWEIVTHGSTPYPGIESKSLAQILLDGYRMPKPENCADDIYDVMLSCWQEEPSNRPSFGKLVQILEEMTFGSDANLYVSSTVYENFVIKQELDDA
ncbi:tyrosine-protein kinase receptor Tie-1-like [Acanthaster planci]|uniref:receptor protein-tyrosine kinase n=1 Tax=Acanthaster planci TaxID=133434 RepID=A0A8B7YWX1_ACAPL|nr:tyrosine-protein kinase receptor Tie-1-like [Acanthaster planci]